MKSPFCKGGKWRKNFEKGENGGGILKRRNIKRENREVN